jgi:hypothetical protein
VLFDTSSRDLGIAKSDEAQAGETGSRRLGAIARSWMMRVSRTQSSSAGTCSLL